MSQNELENSLEVNIDNNEVPSAHEPKPSRKKITRHLRAPVEIRIEITQGAQSFTTTSLNLAMGGVSFETVEELNTGDKINILLYIPVNKELELLKTAAEIVWSEDQEGSWLVGAAFKKFAPGDLRRLKEWLLDSIQAVKEGRSYF